MNRRPNTAELSTLAKNQPELLNILVAFFVMEWRGVTIGKPPHGQDQAGKTRQVPDYVARYGIGDCVLALIDSPSIRTPDSPGLMTVWLNRVQMEP